MWLPEKAFYLDMKVHGAGKKKVHIFMKVD